MRGRFEANTSVLSGGVTSGGLADNTVTSGNIASGQIGRFHVASGQFAGFELGSGAIVSGRIASGQVGIGHLASGIFDYFLMLTGERVSGGQAVCVNFVDGGGGLANTVVACQAGSGLRMPAIGICASNFVSGDVAQVIVQGSIQIPQASGWSGMAGKPLFPSRSGIVVIFSGMLSGDIYQRIGVAFSGGIVVIPNTTMTSGGITAPANGADLM